MRLYQAKLCTGIAINTNNNYNKQEINGSPMQNVKLYLPANLVFSSGVRDIAQEMAELAGFEKKQVNMFRLVVDELFMNAIRYGSNKESHIFFEAVIDGDKIICAIEDEGKGEKQIEADDLKKIIQKEKQENVSLKKIHGRGLAQITSTLVQAFEVMDKEGGGLRMEFIMQKQEMNQTEKVATQEEKAPKLLPEVTFELPESVDMENIDDISEEIENIFEQHNNDSFRLIYDAQKLEYCNSLFLGKLAGWHDELESKGGETVIDKPTQNLFDILDLVGLTQIFKITGIDQEQEAVATT